MTSVSTVSDNRDEFKEIIDGYYNAIDGLKSHWRGDSFNNLKKKADSYSSNGEKVINQFEKYVQVIGLYNGYASLISQKTKAEEEYSAVQYGTNEADKADKYSKVTAATEAVTKREKELKALIKEIESISIDEVTEKNYA